LKIAFFDYLRYSGFNTKLKVTYMKNGILFQQGVFFPSFQHLSSFSKIKFHTMVLGPRAGAGADMRAGISSGKICRAAPRGTGDPTKFFFAEISKISLNPTYSPIFR
jgi:hypothetical protein